MSGYLGNPSNLQAATSHLVRSIAVNGYYLYTESCTINRVQEMEQRTFVQGGARPAIATIGAKSIEGSIKLPVRLDRSGQVEAGIRALLEHAELPMTALRLDTNHVLSTVLQTTAEHGGTDDNRLLSLDCMVIKKLTLSCEEKGKVMLSCDLEGMIDQQNASETFVSPPSDMKRLGRILTWSDCWARRRESAMQTVSRLEISITNTLSKKAYILPADTPVELRDDQISLLAVKSCVWEGTFAETLRVGADKDTYIHGGYMKGENVTLHWGPIRATAQVPLFRISESPYDEGVMKRTSRFLMQISPSMRTPAGGLFSFPEQSE